MTSLLLGYGLGLGLFLLLRGLFPPRPAILTLVDDLLAPRTEAARPTSIQPGLAGWVERRFGGVLLPAISGLGFDAVSSEARRNLRVTGGRPEALVVEKLVLAVVGLGLPVAAAAMLALAGIAVPVIGLVVIGLACGAGGFLLPDARLRAAAEARRKSFRHALSAFLDLVAISLAGGGLVQGAMRDAADIGGGWAFDELSRPLELSQQKGGVPWDALGRLGEELEVKELSELTASLALAGGEGARVRQSLSAKAASLRERRMGDDEAEASRASERMALPLAILGLGFLVFIGYPALSRVLSGVG